MSHADIAASLWADGFARIGSVFDGAECVRTRALYRDESLFRRRIDMENHRFGRGAYKYFAYPLPENFSSLRESLYAELAPIAGDWMKALGLPQTVPASLDGFLALCREHGQSRPTPLLLHYESGSFNCLHQDLYGEIIFPFQIIVALSDPHREYEGGELLLVEQRPRAQSIGHVLHLEQGEAVVITTRYRPVKSQRGHYRANVRHGVSRIASGERFTLGVIFHDAA